VVIDTLLAVPGDANVEAMLRHALPFSGAFLLAYLAIALTVSLAAAAIDPLLRARRRRRARNDPRAAARLSEQRLLRVTTEGRGLFGSRADAILQALRAARWDHDDPRFRSLSADLADVVQTSAAALSTAAPDRRTETGERTTRALEQLQDALAELNRAHGERHEADAQAVARYVELRYGASDFSGSGE
jgi:hypothetical protein